MDETERRKEIRNLKRRLKKLEEKGYKISDTFDLSDLTTTEIHNLRGDTLIDFIEDNEYDEESEDIFADWDEKDSYEDNVLAGVEERIAAFSPYDFPSMYTGLWHEQNKDYLDGLLSMAIADEGREAVARRLQTEGSTRINELVDTILRDSDGDKVEKAIQEFSEIIYSGAMHPVSEYGY